MLGKLPVPGRPTILITVGQWPIALPEGAGGGGLDFFYSHLSFLLFLTQWETARYRLKYCLKGPLSPKRTNQPTQRAVILKTNNQPVSRARAYCACSRCGWGLFGHFYSHLSFLCLPLGVVGWCDGAG